MPPVEQDALIYGPIRVELLTHKVLAQGKFVHLAKMEYRLLCYLILHEGQVLSRQEILTNIWNLPPNVKTRTLDMHAFPSLSLLMQPCLYGGLHGGVIVTIRAEHQPFGAQQF